MRSLLAVASLLIASCAPVPIELVGHSAGPTAGPTPVSTAPGSAPPGLCDILPAGDVALVTGGDVLIDAQSSGPRVCAYVVSGGTSDPDTYVMVVRAADLFLRVDEAEAAFPGGRRVELIGRTAYWAPDLYTLWFDQGESLYAVQELGFDGAAQEALDVARDLALAFLDRL